MSDFADLLRRRAELGWCMELISVAIDSLNRSCRSHLCISAVSRLSAFRRPWANLIHVLSVHMCSLEEADG